MRRAAGGKPVPALRGVCTLSPLLCPARPPNPTPHHPRAGVWPAPLPLPALRDAVQQHPEGYGCQGLAPLRRLPGAPRCRALSAATAAAAVSGWRRWEGWAALLRPGRLLPRLCSVQLQAHRRRASRQVPGSCRLRLLEQVCAAVRGSCMPGARVYCRSEETSAPGGAPGHAAPHASLESSGHRGQACRAAAGGGSGCSRGRGLFAGASRALLEP